MRDAMVARASNRNPCWNNDDSRGPLDNNYVNGGRRDRALSGEDPETRPETMTKSRRFVGSVQKRTEEIVFFIIPVNIVLSVRNAGKVKYAVRTPLRARTKRGLFPAKPPVCRARDGTRSFGLFGRDEIKSTTPGTCCKRSGRLFWARFWTVDSR